MTSVHVSLALLIMDLGVKMKKRLSDLLNNQLLQLLMAGVFIYISFVAVILATLQIPPDAILDSGLKEVLLVFEG